MTIEGENDDWDLGTGAGFYVNATQSPWSSHYRMYDYITIELPGVDQTVENPEVVTYVRALREEFLENFPDFEVRLTGIVMMQYGDRRRTDV